MQVMVVVDVLILLPIVGFMLWLFWFTAPPGRHRRLRRADILLAVAACLFSAAVFSALHGLLDMEGMDQSIIVVAVSYLTFIMAMGVCWLARWRLQVGPLQRDSDETPRRGDAGSPNPQAE